MTNKKVMKVNPELDKMLGQIKFDMKLPKIRGAEQIAQLKLVEFAKIGKQFKEFKQTKQKRPGLIYDFLDTLT